MSLAFECRNVAVWGVQLTLFSLYLGVTKYPFCLWSTGCQVSTDSCLGQCSKLKMEYEEWNIGRQASLCALLHPPGKLRSWASSLVYFKFYFSS